MPTRVPIAREGWSGVDHLAVSRDLGGTSRLIELLPKRKSADLELKEQLLYLGAQFPRYLHQDRLALIKPLV